MGQKGSKKSDLYVTEDSTLSNLTENQVKQYSGRAREYTAVDVSVDNIDPCKAENENRKRSASQFPPESIISVLTKAQRKGYQLSFVVPKVAESKPSKLRKNSFIEEESKSPENNDEKSASSKTSHTVYLLRPKVNTRTKKEHSLKKMDATRTILNIMIDNKDKFEFSVKEFSREKSEIVNGKYAEELQKIIAAEAEKCGKLLSVMVATDKENGSPTVVNGNGEEKKKELPVKKGERLSLRMVFLYNKNNDATPSVDYKVACHQISCTEQALKTKKNQTLKSDRKTNITWSEKWLNVFQEDSKLIEVINVGDLSPVEEAESDPKAKKTKPRQFQVPTLCFYEKPLAGSKGGETYDSMTREVWASIDETMQENLENEAEVFGEFGWELCTVLVTSQVRMKQDGSEFRKCIIFFQRPKEEALSKSEIGKSKENLLENGNGNPEDEDAAPSSPKEKLQKFGVPIVTVDDIGKSRLKSTSKAPSSPVEKKENVLPIVQLKKVDREKLKKDETTKDVGVAQQVKLKPTEVKSGAKEKEDDKEVPWIETLERKRKAVMESEEKAQQKKQEEKERKAEETETETMNVAELKKKAEATAEAAKAAEEATKAQVEKTGKVDKDEQSVGQEEEKETNKEEESASLKDADQSAEDNKTEDTTVLPATNEITDLPKEEIEENESEAAEVDKAEVETEQKEEPSEEVPVLSEDVDDLKQEEIKEENKNKPEDPVTEESVEEVKTEEPLTSEAEEVAQPESATVAEDSNPPVVEDEKIDDNTDNPDTTLETTENIKDSVVETNDLTSVADETQSEPQEEKSNDQSPQAENDSTQPEEFAPPEVSDAALVSEESQNQSTDSSTEPAMESNANPEEDTPVEVGDEVPADVEKEENEVVDHEEEPIPPQETIDVTNEKLNPSEEVAEKTDTNNQATSDEVKEDPTSEVDVTSAEPTDKSDDKELDPEDSPNNDDAENDTTADADNTLESNSAEPTEDLEEHNNSSPEVVAAETPNQVENVADQDQKSDD